MSRHVVFGEPYEPPLRQDDGRLAEENTVWKLTSDMFRYSKELIIAYCLTANIVY